MKGGMYMAQAINRWEPGTGVTLRDAMNQLFEESFVRPFSRNGNGNGNGQHYLPVDIYETDESFVVKAFVPGVTADKIDITTQQQTVTIRAEQPAESQDNVRYYLRERPSGTWLRSFELPTPIDAQHIDAKLEQGVLILTLPKVPEAKPHKVSIKTS
jgi:HSP20 family protein